MRQFVPLLFSFLISTGLLAQTPTIELVKDISPGADASSPTAFFVYKNTLYFSADVDATGRELYKTDGTTNGTVLVKDLRPGSDNSSPNFFFTLRDTLYFSANTGGGSVLFRTDGTDTGTVQVANDFVFNGINIGDSLVYFVLTTAGNSLHTFDGSTIAPAPNAGTGTEAIIGAQFAFYDGKFILYMDYSEDEPTVGRELYQYDLGTQTYTLIKDIDPGTGDASISEFTPLDTLLYFEADNDLWVTDGTDGGTQMIMAVANAGISNVRNLYAWQGELYFEGDDGNGDQLIVYNPAADSVRNLSQFPATAPNNNHDPNHYVPFANQLYYVAEDTTDGEPHLFRTNSTSIIQVDTFYIDTDDLIAMGDTLFFEADEDGVTGNELYRFLFGPLKPSLTDSLEICAGDSIAIPVSGAPSGSWAYVWFADAAATTVLDTTPLFQTPALSADVTYYVRMDSAGALSEIDSVFVAVNDELAAGATITLQGTDTLLAAPLGAGFSYQWLDSLGASIAMATDSIFVPDTTGNFSVIVSGTLCRDTSAVFAYVDSSGNNNTGLITLEGAFELYPNPTAGTLHLQRDPATTGPWQLSLRDLAGREILHRGIAAQEQRLTLDLQDLPAGVYLLHMEAEQGQMVQRIVKQ